jgi:hypothetical protein
MNGASAELCVAISSTPKTSSMMNRGKSQSFFLTLRNCQNSLRNDMSRFQEPVYTGAASRVLRQASDRATVENVFRLDILPWVLGAAAGILIYQLCLSPIVGMADQGDFAKIIGHFGYGPEDKSPELKYAFVGRTYVPDPTYRQPDWEQWTSEYIFVGSALLLNKLVSKDAKLDIVVVGLIHMTVFLAAFARLLALTRTLRAAPLLWIGALLVLTDAGYVAYWNSFYPEPASCLFFVLLLTESLAICQAARVSRLHIARWSLWGFLWVMAKPQNALPGLVLALFSLRLYNWKKTRSIRQSSILAAALIAIAALVNIMTIPAPTQWAATYNQVFMAILPESSQPAADLEFLGLSPDLVRYSGTGAWSAGTAFSEMLASGLIGRRVTPATIARFYFFHPSRIWRHAKAVLPVTFLLRPAYGNFERSAGYAPGAKSAAFSLWSAIHERYLARLGTAILIALLISPALVVAAWVRVPAHRQALEFFGLLSACCLGSFVVAICGDAYDNVKHLLLFNLLLDTWLFAAVGLVASLAYTDK